MTPDGDLEPVATAYREKRKAGEHDLPAYNAALAVFRARHPDMPDGEASKAVAKLIFQAGEK
jgi:hypothetical protein